MEWLCANTLIVIIVQINEQKFWSVEFHCCFNLLSWILYESVGLLMFLVYFSLKVPSSCSFISFECFYVTILRPTLLYNFRVFFPMYLLVSCLFL